MRPAKINFLMKRRITIDDLQIISQNNNHALDDKELSLTSKPSKNLLNKKKLSCKEWGYSGSEFSRTFSGCKKIKKPIGHPHF